MDVIVFETKNDIKYILKLDNKKLTIYEKNSEHKKCKSVSMYILTNSELY